MLPSPDCARRIASDKNKSYIQQTLGKDKQEKMLQTYTPK